MAGQLKQARSLRQKLATWLGIEATKSLKQRRTWGRSTHPEDPRSRNGDEFA